MRLFFVAASFCFVAAAATTFACSSSSPATESADAGKDAAKAPVTTGDDDDIAQTPTPGPTDSGVTDAGNPDAATTGGQLVKSGDGGLDCDDDSYREAEQNNTAGTANQFPAGPG